MRMKLSVCIEPLSDGFVKIVEHAGSNQYLSEESELTAKDRFKYEDTASVDIFRLNSTEGQQYTNPVIVRRDSYKEPKIKLTKDGWFTSIHLVIPVKEWIYRELGKKHSIIYVYDKVFFTDGSRIFCCTKGKITDSNITELLEDFTDNAVSRCEAEHVSVMYLQDKLKDSYLALFKNRLYNGGCNTDPCAANRYLSAYNLVRHYVRMGQLAEAERVIEKVDYFSLNRKPIKKDLKHYNNCGCL